MGRTNRRCLSKKKKCHWAYACKKFLPFSLPFLSQRGIFTRYIQAVYIIQGASQHTGSYYVDFIRSRNQVTNMDDVCKFFDFVVFMCFF